MEEGHIEHEDFYDRRGLDKLQPHYQAYFGWKQVGTRHAPDTRPLAPACARLRVRLRARLRARTRITTHANSPTRPLGTARESARDANGLQELGVTHVLNGTSQLPNFHPNKFVYLKIEMLDAPETPIVSYQKKASKFIQHIEEKGGRVLVHW